MALEKHFCSLQPQGLGCSNGREKILILLGMILPTASFTFFLFYRGNVHHFTVGAGEGQFGLWLDSSLCQGRTQACSTYNNPPLVGAGEAGGGDFVVKTIECWAFD